jgi:hypothetical protein
MLTRAPKLSDGRRQAALDRCAVHRLEKSLYGRVMKRTSALLAAVPTLILAAPAHAAKPEVTAAFRFDGSRNNR